MQGNKRAMCKYPNHMTSINDIAKQLRRAAHLDLVCLVTNLVRRIFHWLRNNLGYLVLGLLCLMLEVICGVGRLVLCSVGSVLCLMLGFFSIVVCPVLGLLKVHLIVITVSVLVILQQQTDNAC